MPGSRHGSVQLLAGIVGAGTVSAPPALERSGIGFGAPAPQVVTAAAMVLAWLVVP